MGLIIKDGVIYNGAESEPVVYSLDEREIGVWIDGKPLYQKTWDFGSNLSVSYSSWTVSPIPKNGFDTIVQCVNGIIGNQQACWGILSTSLEVNNTYIALLCGRYADNCNVRYLTLQYTKTTDTPGSGTWTPSGVKAEHYSTNEHVVGTWIDGSTVYEKTFITPTISNTTIDIDLGFAIGMGVVVHGYYLLNDTNGSMISANQWFGTDNFSWTHIELNTHLLRCRLAGYTGVGYITIRYTKTT